MEHASPGDADGLELHKIAPGFLSSLGLREAL